jgi:hypothetical protein
VTGQKLNISSTSSLQEGQIYKDPNGAEGTYLLNYDLVKEKYERNL